MSEPLAESEPSSADDPFAVDPCDDQGVDRSLIRWMLSMSPIERLRCLQDRIDFLSRVRTASPPSRASDQ